MFVFGFPFRISVEGGQVLTCQHRYVRLIAPQSSGTSSYTSRHHHRYPAAAVDKHHPLGRFVPGLHFCLRLYPTDTIIFAHPYLSFDIHHRFERELSMSSKPKTYLDKRLFECLINFGTISPSFDTGIRGTSG